MHIWGVQHEFTSLPLLNSLSLSFKRFTFFSHHLIKNTWQERLRYDESDALFGLHAAYDLYVLSDLDLEPTVTRARDFQTSCQRRHSGQHPMLVSTVATMPVDRMKSGAFYEAEALQ